MSALNTLTALTLLTQLLERTAALGGLLRRAKSEGRDISDEELDRLRGEDDTARAQLEQAISSARQRREGGRARLATLVVLSLLACGIAWAAVHSSSWTKATTNTDGSAIPATGAGSITTTVEYGTCNGQGFGTRIADVIAGTSSSTAPTPNLGPGTYCFRAKHTNTYGVDSDWSQVAQLIEAPPKPNPPTGLTIQ